MKASKRKPGGSAAALAALLLLSLVSGVVASSDKCASSNTGSDHTSSIYMSNGLCTNHCSGHAYAILQHEDCWCSDVDPGTTTDPSNCNSPCPGYPMNTCGNAASGLYQYIPLGKAPVSSSAQDGGFGGGGGGSAASASSPTFFQQSPSSPPVQSTVVQMSVQTTTNTPDPTTVASTQYLTSASTVSATPSSTTISSIESTTITPSPSIVTSASVLTVSGAVVTSMVTSAPTTTSPPFADSRLAAQTSHQLSNGAVAGITVGAIAGAALLLLVALFFWWRRRRQQRAAEMDGEGSITRTGSVMSKMGLLRTGSGTSAPLGTSDGHGGPTLPQILTAVPAAHGPESSSTNMSENRRFSRPMFVDSRLNPHAVMLHNDTSRTSIATLQDNQDYSRPLEVRNPD